MQTTLMLLAVLSALSVGVCIRHRLESSFLGICSGLMLIVSAIFLGAFATSGISLIAFLFLFTGAGIIFGDPTIRIGITYSNGEPDADGGTRANERNGSRNRDFRSVFFSVYILFSIVFFA